MMENKENRDIITDWEHGIMGYHIWNEIKEKDGKYIIEITPRLIEKGLLKVNEPYNIAFRFAKHVCPNFRYDEWIWMSKPNLKKLKDDKHENNKRVNGRN